MRDYSGSERIVGLDVYDLDGSKVGRISEVYYVDDSEKPEWAVVSTGLHGVWDKLVPLHGSHKWTEAIRVGYTKNEIRHAPDVKLSNRLSPEDEAAIHGYYRVSSVGLHKKID